MFLFICVILNLFYHNFMASSINSWFTSLARFTAILCVIATTWKLLMCPLDEWIEKLRYPSRLESYLTLYKKKCCHLQHRDKNQRTLYKVE